MRMSCHSPPMDREARAVCQHGVLCVTAIHHRSVPFVRSLHSLVSLRGCSLCPVMTMWQATSKSDLSENNPSEILLTWNTSVKTDIEAKVWQRICSAEMKLKSASIDRSICLAKGRRIPEAGSLIPLIISSKDKNSWSSRKADPVEEANV